MASSRDKNGRPVVVVTGMGVITSLGAGKADNWAKLTAGESGIHRITRFANEGLKTTIAGSVDFVPVEPFCSTELGERMAAMVAEEAIAEAGIGSKGDFPGPLFLAVAPVEIEWPHREALAAGVRRQRRGRIRRSPARERVGPLPRHSRALPVRLGRRASRRSLRHQGLADFGVDRLRIGRERDPARRRGDPPRRGRSSALHRHRRFGQSGVADPLLAALRAVDRKRSAAGGGKAVLQESRRLRHGGGRRRPRARELRVRQGARGKDPRRAGGLRRDGGFVPSHPLEPRRQGDHRLHPQRHRGCRSHCPTTSTTSIRTAPGRPRTTRWNISAYRPCSASARNRSRSRRTNR